MERLQAKCWQLLRQVLQHRGLQSGWVHKNVIVKGRPSKIHTKQNRKQAQVARARIAISKSHAPNEGQKQGHGTYRKGECSHCTAPPERLTCTGMIHGLSFRLVQYSRDVCGRQDHMKQSPQQCETTHEPVLTADYNATYAGSRML